MEKKNKMRAALLVLFIITLILIFIFTSSRTLISDSAPQPRVLLHPDSPEVSDQTITPLENTKHFLVSAFMDQRVAGFDIRIIGIFRRDSIQSLHCVFLCQSSTLSISDTTPANILQHADHFDFAFTATDVTCQIPRKCEATHVALLTRPDQTMEPKQRWLPIRNRPTGKKGNEFEFDFTVCVSSLFGGYNNVLQFAQTLEMYRLLGVNRVVIYNTSCGPELDRLLRSYSHEGFVEMVPWPIDKHLVPSHGWRPSEHAGDLHYFGQLTTLNECVYRSMERSRYVLLNDIDEIIMPYQHEHLKSLMESLQQQHPNTGVFYIENHIFPKKHFEPSNRFHLPQWRGVPGINILEHVYREDPDRSRHHPYKLIVQPRMVEQTSVHAVLKNFGERYNVPPEVCRIVHVRVALRGSLTLEQLNVDKRLWDFHEQLIPNVDNALRRVGLLSSDQ